MSRKDLTPIAAQNAAKIFPIFMNDAINYVSRLGIGWAPGCVNLIGEHIDYNDGFVLPIAVNRVVALAARAHQDRIVRIWSSHFREYAQFSLDGLQATFEQQKEVLPNWVAYIMAVVAELMLIGFAPDWFDAVVNGDVSVGGGMSSSAAIEIATTQVCALMSNGQFMIGIKRQSYNRLKWLLFARALNTRHQVCDRAFLIKRLHVWGDLERQFC